MTYPLSPLDAMREWVLSHQTGLQWLAIFSGICFLVSLFVIPILVVKIPSDYFMRRKRKAVIKRRQNPNPYRTASIFKNVLGALFILAGIAMLVLPGQGLLTILIGLMLTNFPGKFALERWIIRQPTVNRSINWLRAKANRPPLQIP